jgi:integrase
MMARLAKTSAPGIFRRHVNGCEGDGRCDCSYVLVWRHRGRQHKETFRTFAEAREGKANRDAGDRRPAPRIRVGDYFSEWIESYAGRTARGFSETSRDEYRRVIDGEPMKRWGTWKLSDVEPSDIRALLGTLRKRDVSTSEIRKTRSALSAMFGTAVDDGMLRSNPAQGARIPAARNDEGATPDSKAMTREELTLLLAALPEDWRLFFGLLTHTGLRISEAVGLTWASAELGERPRLKVREQVYRGKRRRLKSGSGRRDLPLSPDMTAGLLGHRRDTYMGEEAPIFCSATGGPLSPPNLGREVLHPAREAAGLIWVTFHTFRHTCASLLFEEGRNVKQVAEWLGHADPSFTLRTYVHLMDAGIGDAGFLDHVVSLPPKATPGQHQGNSMSENSHKPALARRGGNGSKKPNNSPAGKGPNP